MTISRQDAPHENSRENSKNFYRISPNYQSQIFYKYRKLFDKNDQNLILNVFFCKYTFVS